MPIAGFNVWRTFYITKFSKLNINPHKLQLLYKQMKKSIFTTLLGVALTQSGLRTAEDGQLDQIDIGEGSSRTFTTTSRVTSMSSGGSGGSYSQEDADNLSGGQTSFNFESGSGSISLGGGSGSRSGLNIGGGGSSFSTGGGSSFSSGGVSSFSSGGSSGFSSGGSGSISAFFPVNTVGGGQGRLTGVSDLFVSGGGIGGRGGRGGNVLITSAGTGQSNIISGKVITDGKFPSANINAFTNSNSNVDSNVLASRIIRNARNISSRLSVDLDDVFTRLPSLQQIDQLILQSDTIAILKTIQVVSTENALSCDQKISYLLQLLGRVKAAVEKKNFSLSQLSTIVDSASTQVQRLQTLINQNNAQIDKINITSLKSRLDAFVADLQKTYVQYNKVQSQIPVLEAQIVGGQKQIQVLLRNSDTQRNRINNDKIKLSTIGGEIAALQSKIRQLQDRQAALQASIKKGQSVITQNDKAIVVLKNRISGFQDQIRKLTEQADTLGSKVKDLQVKAGRVRTEINVADTKRNRILRDNMQLEQRLTIQKRKNIPTDVGTLKDMVESLRRMIPTVQSEIDRQYYYCFGDGKVQVQNNGGVVVYVVRGQAFANYLRNIYGQNIVVPSVSGNVLLNPIDIFGQSWVGNFGYPFGSGAFQGVSDMDLSLGGSFSCLNPGAMVTGYGTITKIGSNWIQAQDQQQVRRFNLGSCSRLQSTNNLPQIGQKFYWAGVPASQGFNLYTGSCL